MYEPVGCPEGDLDGTGVGSGVGHLVMVGLDVGRLVCGYVGDIVGTRVGFLVGFAVGDPPFTMVNTSSAKSDIQIRDMRLLTIPIIYGDGIYLFLHKYKYINY